MWKLFWIGTVAVRKRRFRRISSPANLASRDSMHWERGFNTQTSDPEP